MSAPIITITNNSNSTNQYYYVETGTTDWDNTLTNTSVSVTNVATGASFPEQLVVDQITNFYFWNIPPSSTFDREADYGLSLTPNSSGTGAQLLGIAPGTLSTQSGVLAYYLQNTGNGIKYSILDIINITVNNGTGAALPYFINTTNTQNQPLKLTDYQKNAATTNTIPTGPNNTLKVFNTTGTLAGIYFFDPNGAASSNATAGSLVNLTNSTTTNTAGTMTVGGNGTSLVVELTSSTLTITIVNNTGATLPFYINTTQSQPHPLQLTDFTKNSTNGSVSTAGSLNVSAFNTSGDYCGIYFFDPNGADTSTATAASLVQISTKTITNTTGTTSINSSGTTINVGGNGNGNGGMPWWGWLLIAVVVLIIIIIIVVAANSHKNKEKDQQTAIAAAAAAGHHSGAGTTTAVVP